jgi:pimeloyl-ACP methyl ester carboxylesterase
MGERTVDAGGVEIWTEDVGDPSDPALLLLQGSGAQGILWEDELCAALAGAGRHVIRYDHRDVGRSSVIDFAQQPYTLADLAADALAVLDAYDVDAAHLVGASMGGGVAQRLALDHPDRVLTLTLLFTSPALQELLASATGQDTGCELAMPQSEELLAVVTEMLTNPPTTRAERVDFDVRRFGVLAGSRYPLDDARWRDLLGRSHDRAREWAAANNHSLAMLGSEADLRPRLAQLDVPTLVIHGTEDPAVPFAHGQALADTIPGAKLVPIDGYGHQFAAEVYPLWVELITAHTAGAR